MADFLDISSRAKRLAVSTMMIRTPLPTSNRNGAAPPITYMVDGKQYVAFMAGTGRPAQTVGPTDAKVDNPPMLFVFDVGGTATLPPPLPPGAGRGPVAPPPPPASDPVQELHK